MYKKRNEVSRRPLSQQALSLLLLSSRSFALLAPVVLAVSRAVGAAAAEYHPRSSVEVLVEESANDREVDHAHTHIQTGTESF